jgi:hypothetical protein
VELRPAYRPDRPFFRPYFHDGYAYYPHYAPSFSFSIVYYSPYYCYDVCPPWIYRQHCYYAPPPIVIVDRPIYIVADDDDGDYYLSSSAWRRDSDFQRTIDDIEDAFRNGDIELLAEHVSNSTKIAIYNSEKYEYSLDGNDYLDMTRDALKSMDTVRFDLYRIRERRPGVYVASGAHEYKNSKGDMKRVLISIGLERRDGRWIITQIRTAADTND